MIARTTSLFLLASAVACVQGAPRSESEEMAETQAAKMTGTATWFKPGLGACGHTNDEHDFIVAPSSDFFERFSDPTHDSNKNHLCKRTLRITHGHTTVNATVEDECPSCRGQFDLDLSPAVFKKFADLGAGEIQVTWELL